MWQSFISPRFLANIFGGNVSGDANQVDYLSDTIKVAILADTYTPSDTHEFYSDVSGDEITATGYTAGGPTLASKTISYDSARQLVTLDAANTFASADVDDGEARYGALYDDTVSTKPLLGWLDFGSIIDDVNTNGGSQYGFTWNTIANGILTFQTWAPGMVAWYGKAFANAFGGESSGEDRRTDFLSDTINVALLDNGHTLDLDGDEVFSDVSGDEVSGSGYTAGGVALSGKSLALSGHALTFDAADLDFGTVSLTDARYAVAYNVTNADEPLLWVVDLLADLSPAAEAFSITWPANGIARLRCA